MTSHWLTWDSVVKERIRYRPFISWMFTTILIDDETNDSGSNYILGKDPEGRKEGREEDEERKRLK